MRHILFILLFLTTSSCSIFSNDPVVRRSESYTFSNPDENWSFIRQNEADHAFTNPKTGGIIFINSYCRRELNSTLRYLAQNMLSPLEDLAILKQQDVVIQGSNAIKTYAYGQADGKDSYIEVTTIKRLPCVYDIALISRSEKDHNADIGDYNKILDSLRFKDE